MFIKYYWNIKSSNTRMNKYEIDDIPFRWILFSLVEFGFLSAKKPKCSTLVFQADRQII